MKSILITGASRGIGRSIALEAARSGNYNRIIINCHKNISLLDSVQKEIRKIFDENLHYYNNVHTEPLCLTSVGDVGDLSYVETLHTEIGRVEHLVNNSALSITGLLTDMTPSEWDLIVKTNLTSIYNTCHTFAPDMIKERHGKIINISSVWGIVGASCEVAYSATKGAVNAFTKALAKELAPNNIQVNAAALGIADTDMNSHLTPEDKSDIIEDIPAGYIMSPDEAGRAVIKLLEMPDYFTGEIIKLDGGWQ